MRAAHGVTAIVLALCLAACSRAAPKPPSVPETALIGTGRPALVACAGAPATIDVRGGREYFLYRRETTVGEGYLQDAPRIPGIGSLAIGTKGSQVACEATVILKDGVVDAVGFRTVPTQNSAVTAALCRPILASCPTS